MAWTERYVRADAAGGGDGTTDANSGANGAWTLAEGITNESAGMRINIKAGTYANTTTNRTWAAAGTQTQPIWWRGFKTTLGDLDARPTSSRTVSTDIPHLTWSTGVGSCSGAHHKFSNMSFLVTGSSANAAFRTLTSDSSMELHRCRFEHQSSGSASNRGLRCSVYTIAHECYVKATTAAIAVYCESTRSSIHDSVIESGLTGLHFDGMANASGNLILSTGGDAIFLNATNTDFFITGNTIYNPTGHGISIPSGFVVRGFVTRNLFHTVTGSGKAGIKNNTVTALSNVWRWGNAYYNVTTPEDGFGDTPDFDRITEGSDPLTNPGSDDFSYKTTATGFQGGPPGLFEGLTFASYASPGAHIPARMIGGQFQLGVV